MSAQTVAAVEVSALDQVTGVALRFGLTPLVADQWCVCVCADGRHREADLVTDPVWGEGGHIDQIPWRATRAKAAQDLLLTPVEGAHRVIRRARLVLDAVEADL